MNGFLMNDLVAPTSCIVFIMNLFEWIDILMVLLIIVSAIRNRKALITRRKMLIFLTFSFIRKRRDSEYWTSFTKGYPRMYFSIFATLSGLVYCCLLYTSDAADEEDSVDLGG